MKLPKVPKPDLAESGLVFVAVGLFVIGFVFYGATRTPIETVRFMLPMAAILILLVSLRSRVDRLDNRTDNTSRTVANIEDFMVDKDDLAELVLRFRDHLDTLRTRVEAIEAKLAAGETNAATDPRHEAAPDQRPGEPLR